MHSVNICIQALKKKKKKKKKEHIDSEENCLVTQYWKKIFWQ